MIAKFLLLTLAACLPLFSAPDDTRAVDVRKTIQGLKSSIAQLQDQIAVLEMQLSSLEANSINARDTNTQSPSAPIVSLSSPTEPSQTRLAPTKLKETERQQCTGVTQKGTRCSRMAAPGKTTCWQH